MLTWNVYMENFNARKIVVFNIFDHHSFREDCKKNAKKYKDDRDGFLQEVERDLRYYFWSKAEYEIVLSSLFTNGSQQFREEKIDIYDQVMMNWPIFADYIWANRKEFAKIQ